MVGTDTALLDNPSLTVKRWAGRSPVRALIDNKLRFLNAAASCKSQPPLLDASAPTLIFSASHEAANVKISKENISIIHLPEAALSLAAILKNLYERGLHSLLVEGGARLHQSFLQSDLWDEIVVETTSHVLVEGVRAPDISALQNVKMYEYETVPFFAEEGLKPSKIQKYYK